MTNADTFRDLSKPVGALNKERLDRLLVRLFADGAVVVSEKLLDDLRAALSFTGSLQRYAWTLLHVRQPLLVTRLRPLLPSQSWWVTPLALPVRTVAVFAGDGGFSLSMRWHNSWMWSCSTCTMLKGCILAASVCFNSFSASPPAPEHMLCLQNGRYDNADRIFNR